jgi:hypothetical protein
MPIFASTTTSGYSDPLKAQSIKALEQRQKDLLAQQAQQAMPESMPSPFQVGGHVLNQLASGMQQRRADQALSSQREVLARAMSGYDPVGDAPPPSIIASVAPDQYKDMMQTWAANRQQKALFAQQDRARTEDARLAEAQKAADEARFRERPQSDIGKLAADAGRKPTAEEIDASIAKTTAPSASEMKAGNELQNTHLDTQSAISDLKEARDLLGPKGTGIRVGSGAGMAQTGAKWGGDTLGLTDPALTQPTERYNQLMNAEAITAMAQKLKGASTDYEMKAFVALMNDPNAEGETKVQALNKMIAKAEAHYALQLDQMKRARVPVPAGAAPAATASGGGASATAPAPAASMPRPAGKNDSDLIAEAKAASANATPAQKAAIDAQLQKWLMGP